MDTGEGDIEVDASRRKSRFRWKFESRVGLARSQAAWRRQTAQGLEERSKKKDLSFNENFGVSGVQPILVLALEVLDKAVDESVVEALTSQVSATSSGLDLRDTLLDGLVKRHIEVPPPRSKTRKNVAFIDHLLVETVGDSSDCGIIDAMEHIHTRDCSGILGALLLGVVK